MKKATLYPYLVILLPILVIFEMYCKHIGNTLAQIISSCFQVTIFVVCAYYYHNVGQKTLSLVFILIGSPVAIYALYLIIYSIIP